MSKKNTLKIDAAKMGAASITPPTMNSVAASESASADATVNEPQADTPAEAEAPKPSKLKGSQASASADYSNSFLALAAGIREELAKNTVSNDRLSSSAEAVYGQMFGDGMEPTDFTDKPGRKALCDRIEALTKRINKGFETFLAKEDKIRIDKAVGKVSKVGETCKDSFRMFSYLTGVGYLFMFVVAISVSFFEDSVIDDYKRFVQEVRQELPNTELVNHIRTTDPDAFDRYTHSLEEEKAQKAFNDSIQLANEIKAKIEKSRKKR